MGPHNRKTDSQPRGIVDDLLRAIVKSKLSQYQLAKDTAVPQPILSRFLSGQRGISLDTAAKIAAHLGLRLR